MFVPVTTVSSTKLNANDGLLRRITLATMVVVSLAGIGHGIGGAELTLVAQRAQVERTASLLAIATAARMEGLTSRERAALARETSQALNFTVTVLNHDARPVYDAPSVSASVIGEVLRRGGTAGEARIDNEDVAVALVPLMSPSIEREFVVVVSPLPSPIAQRGAVALLALKLVAALACIGIVAVAVSLIVAQDITNDLKAVLRRTVRMVTGATAALRPLPVQASDEVGGLVVAFNRLQSRFADELALHREAIVRLDENERLQETLVATLRHELRTPLNSILGFAELMLQEVDGPLSEAQRDDVQLIARSGEALLRMVDDVLDLSAMASGRYELKSEPIDLAVLARDVVAEAQGTARIQNVVLTVDGIEHADVYADPVALRRALVNLVVNAIEHAGGEVKVVVSERDRGWAVSVTDNGPGIAAAELKRLFKPFERGRTAEARGAGLGLAITLGLVELHGGTLSAHSVVGEGSTFTATVPLGLAPLPAGNGGLKKQ
jgi:signal transduction histidine kinase